MKKISTYLSIVLLLVCLQALSVSAQETDKSKQINHNWKSTKDNVWPGVSNKEVIWYKMDANGKLMWSPDKKEWKEDSDGMWADKEGVFYKLDGSKLSQSLDAGHTWIDATEWKWIATDGRWYKLDQKNAVWVSK